MKKGEGAVWPGLVKVGEDILAIQVTVNIVSKNSEEVTVGSMWMLGNEVVQESKDGPEGKKQNGKL